MVPLPRRGHHGPVTPIIPAVTGRILIGLDNILCDSTQGPRVLGFSCRLREAGVGQWSGAAAERRRCCTAVHHGPTIVSAVFLMTSASF